MLELSEWNELNNISVHMPSELLTVERGFVGIELIHGLEISLTDSYDDN